MSLCWYKKIKQVKQPTSSFNNILSCSTKETNTKVESQYKFSPQKLKPSNSHHGSGIFDYSRGKIHAQLYSSTVQARKPQMTECPGLQCANNRIRLQINAARSKPKGKTNHILSSLAEPQCNQHPAHIKWGIRKQLLDFVEQMVKCINGIYITKFAVSSKR